MSDQIKALIIDDEALSADMLQYLIAKNLPSVSEVKKTTSAVEGIRMIETFKPDILFLDIQMPFMTGFELLEKLKKHSFSVIFVTAYNKYAIKAIRFSALDYLLKPIDPEELIQAIERYRQQRHEKKQFQELYGNFVNNLKAGENKSYKLALHTHQGLRLIAPHEILHCEARNNYTVFYLTDNSTITTSKTIKEYEEILNEYNFVRVHKSHLVNLSFVEEFTNKQQLLLSDKSLVDVSRRRKAELLEALKRK